jgi:BirA family biotin operon repressor/biotin-[acetyl-CoA-carboxylase] ligase
LSVAPYDLARLRAAAGGGVRRVEFREETGSTQDLAFLLAEHGAPDGAVALAERQTAGRGRLGRAWDSPAGAGIWFSRVVRPSPPAPPLPLLVAATALAVAEAVEGSCGVRALLRWPNDLLAGGRKLGGILLETRDWDPAAPLAVLGVGVNADRPPDGYPADVRAIATSLAAERGGAAPDRTAALAAILDRLDARLGALAGPDAAREVDAAYRARAAHVGSRVTLLEGDVPRAGVLEEASPLGGLRLRGADGALLVVRAEHARELRGAP